MSPDTVAYTLVGAGTLERQIQRGSRIVNSALLITGDGKPTAGIKRLPIYLEGTDTKDLFAKISAAVSAAIAATQVKLVDGAGATKARFDVAGFKSWSVRSWPNVGNIAVVELVFVPKTPDWVDPNTLETEVYEW